MNLIAAVDQNWAIGRDGDQLCYIPADLKRFQAFTVGHAVILGRRTLATFPGGRPLKGRRNLILTHDPAFSLEGAEAFHSVEELLSNSPEDAFVIGGASIYKALLPACDTAYITKVGHAWPEADSFFPNLDTDPAWEVVCEDPPLYYESLSFRYVTYQRKRRSDGNMPGTDSVQHGKEYSCPIESLLATIAGKWKVKILRCISCQDSVRLHQITEAIPQAGRQVLLQQLRELEKNGLVRRTRYAEMPPRVEYSLTDMGARMTTAVAQLYRISKDLHGGWSQGGEDVCPGEQLLSYVVQKWEIRILKALSAMKSPRFQELCRAIPDISVKVLTQKLRQFEADGLLTRTQYSEMPPHVEYRLTRLGFGVVDAMMEFRQYGYGMDDLVDMSACAQCRHYMLRESLSLN